MENQAHLHQNRLHDLHQIRPISQDQPRIQQPAKNTTKFNRKKSEILMNQVRLFALVQQARRRTRAYKSINMMRRIKVKSWGASTELILTMYNVLFRPILTMSKSNQDKIERILRAAARVAILWPLHTSYSFARQSIQPNRQVHHYFSFH